MREREEDPEVLEVYPCNWQTVQAWLRLTRSWSVASTMEQLIYLGLRPEAIESVLNIMGISAAEKLEIYDGITVMESAALEIINGR